MAFIEDLMNVLNPSGEAEAATRGGPNPLLLQQRIEIMRQQAQARAMLDALRAQQLQQSIQSQQALAPVKQQTAEAKLETTKAKAEPKTSSVDLISALRGGQAGVEAPFFYGKSQRTGIPAFTNIPGEYTPVEPGAEAPGQVGEVARGYNKAYEQFQAQPKAPAVGKPTTVSPERQAAFDARAEAIKKQYPGALAERMIEQEARQYGIEVPSKAGVLREERMAKPLEKAASSYIHQETGYRAKPDMTYGEVTEKGSPWLSLDPDQEKIWDGLNTLKNHVLATEQYLTELPKKSPLRSAPINSFIMWLRTQTDPKARALAQQLDSLTPLALSRTFSSGGRGGPTLATMIREGGILPGETVESAIEKFKNLKGMGYMLAKDNSLPTKPFGPDWEQAANEIAKGAQAARTSASQPSLPPRVKSIKRIN